LEIWRDTHAGAKVKAAAELETRRRQLLWAAAHKSRQEAVELANPRFTGRPCKHGHHGERYTFGGGGCCECARISAERRRRLRGAVVKGPMPQARHPLKSIKRAAARQAKAYGREFRGKEMNIS